MMTKTWMVGKVEAPAKANRIELKAEKHPLYSAIQGILGNFDLFQNLWSSKDLDGLPPILDEVRLGPASRWHSYNNNCSRHPHQDPVSPKDIWIVIFSLGKATPAWNFQKDKSRLLCFASLCWCQPNVHDIFLHILQIFTHHNNQAASHSWDQGTDSNKPCWGNMNSEIVPHILYILLCQKS